MSPDALAIRDYAFDKLSAFQGVAPALFRHVGKVPVDQEPDTDLPSMLVLASREAMTPDGDVGVGEPSFRVDLTLDFLISLSGNDRDKADDRLKVRAAAVYALLKDPEFLGQFEGISALTSTRMFDHDGERYFVRERIEMTVRYWNSFEPIVPDDFASMKVRPRAPTDVEPEPQPYQLLAIPQE